MGTTISGASSKGLNRGRNAGLCAVLGRSSWLCTARGKMNTSVSKGENSNAGLHLNFWAAQKRGFKKSLNVSKGIEHTEASKNLTVGASRREKILIASSKIQGESSAKVNFRALIFLSSGVYAIWSALCPLYFCHSAIYSRRCLADFYVFEAKATP